MEQIPLEAFRQVITGDDIGQNAKTFIGKPVVDYGQATKPKKRGLFGFGKREEQAPAPPVSPRTDVVYRFRSGWEKPKLLPNLELFLASEQALQAEGIVTGIWDEPGDPPEDLLKLLVDSRESLPHLAAIYFGDITSEENEMSWIQQCDLSPLLASFPNLQFLRSRGGTGLAFSSPQHANLRGLALETGGMDVSVIRSIGMSNFPNLEYLELWLGTEQYGANHSVADLQPILSGRLFPKLRYLGLRNSELADDIAGVVVNSPLIQRIETLDLSLGVVTDEGGKALLKMPPSPTLKNLNLHYNYITPDLIGQLEQLPLNVDASKPDNMEEDDEWRFVAVGE